jgi:N-acetyl-1-D-myo-inositol-2-amino-2-deoxy-alpha-D-glucopyranoside deacetylase/mycothiol S-conjugate amidase
MLFARFIITFMNKQQTLVFFGAHPDDEAFGAGGTLAQYAAAGVKVYYACATRGEAGESAPEFLKGYASMGDMRWAELECSARTLGLAGVIHIGYRDSGMTGSKDNTNPEALIVSPVDEVAGRMVKIIRDLRPEVVVTFDPIGGYRHPDHIAVHKAAVKAFHAAGDGKQYPDAGIPFQPQKLYYSIFSRRFLKIAVKMMPLFGQDPRHLGVNKDINLAGLVEEYFPINAVIHLTSQSKETGAMASACYKSQLGGTPRRSFLFRLAEKVSRRNDLFTRAYPPVAGGKKERDLFEGIRD